MEEYKAVFEYFDKTNCGHISAKKVATTLRCLNPKPDESVIEKEVGKLAVAGDVGKCDFDGFLECLHKTIRVTSKKKNGAAKKKNVVCTTISDERRAEMKESFDTFDHDGDGTISLDELKTVMASCGLYITEEEANDIILEFGHTDAERGNNLNFDEFVQLMSMKEGGDLNSEIREAFNFFDKDGSGTISAEEVKTVMLALGEDISDSDVFDMIKEADSNGNGEVCYQDFFKILTGF